MGIDYVDLLGKPFKLGGDGPECYDCVGLVCEMLRRLGVSYDTNFNRTEYPIASRNKELLKYFKSVKKLDTPSPGSVILFNHESGLVTHIGVMISDTHFIHTTKQTNVVVERLSKDWQWKINSIYSLN